MIPTAIARDPTWTILYDADCGFCRWSLAKVLVLDRRGRLRPLKLATPEADELLHDLLPEQREASWHLVAPDGRRASGGTAAAPLLRILPAGAAPAALLERAPGPTDRVYGWVVEHRSLLSRLIPEAAKRRADRRIARRS